MSQYEYLIWSNERRGWWRQNRCGYTAVIQWAGVFDEQTALEILAGASIGEQCKVSDRVGTYTDQVVPKEVLVPLTVEGHPGGPDCPPHPRQWVQDAATADRQAQ